MRLFKFLEACILFNLSVSNMLAYRHLSPYAYCAGDPVNNIDPTGESIYALTDSGKVVLALITEDNFDYIVSPDGSRQIINDQSILSSLAMGKAAVSFSEELVNLFFFASDHSNVEWGCAGLLDGSFLMGTNNNQSEVALSSMLDVVNKDNTWFQMHTHSFEEEATKGGSIPDRALYDLRITESRNSMGVISKMLYLPFVYHKASQSVYLYNNSSSMPGVRYGTPRQFSSHGGLQHTFNELYLNQFQLH